MLLLILDSLGGTELLVILVVALVIFGPRKLPQLSRSLGRSLADFRRASQDFKETWEKEARLAEELKEDSISRAMLPPEQEGFSTTATIEAEGSVPQDDDDAAASVGTTPALVHPVAEGAAPLHPPVSSDVVSAALVHPPSIRPVSPDSSLVQDNGLARADLHPATAEQSRKQDWV